MNLVDPRELLFRASVATFWLASIGLASVLAVRSRDEFATVKADSGYWLVALTAPAVLAAVIAIRGRLILAVTILVSGSLSVAWSWSIMRDESSTAAIGIFFAPITVLFLVLLGCGVDYVHRHAARPSSRARR